MDWLNFDVRSKYKYYLVQIMYKIIFVSVRATGADHVQKTNIFKMVVNDVKSPETCSKKD